MTGYFMLEGIFEKLLPLGYLGIFLIAMFGSATVFFPLPITIFIFTAGGFLNPFLVGILGGLGATLGELTSYGIGFGGRRLVEKRKKQKEEIEKAKNFFLKYGGFLALIIFAATPLPEDILGITCGVLKYNLKKFLAAVFIGKIILYLAIAFAGHYGINWILDYFVS